MIPQFKESARTLAFNPEEQKDWKKGSERGRKIVVVDESALDPLQFRNEMLAANYALQE